ncbi:Type II pantothenate kinase [Paenibacillus solanacearum]|uniref:Type II pantothenate kinase n=1 Tax=Paenibacillus solanacearum TaxID=2048548 RepID=A0A916NLZ7_9BACL|nr:type II pantothenate kinase [Paenibacillus solanacearum]CAG7651460.1 Type II pantothenate kinase [Paenibacillus solanacearum]
MRDKQRKGNSKLVYSSYLGIDAGGTLVKFAFYHKGILTFHKIPSAHMSAAAAWITEQFSGAQLCVTGGKSKLLQSYLGREMQEMVEFEATCSGAAYLLKEQGTNESSYVLTNVGTGTSIHFVQGEEHSRVGGTGVGGGTLMGLSYLLTGHSDYRQIMSLSREGDRANIDLKVSHIYEGAEPPIPGELTASNFGRVLQGSDSSRDADKLACVVGLVGETVTTMSVLAAGKCGVATVVYIGSSFVDNDLLREIVLRYTVLRGAQPIVLANGEFSGAIGALRSVYRES